MDDVLLLVGGIIPDEDIPALREMGFEGIFRPGTVTSEIIEFIRQNVRAAAGGSPPSKGERP